MLYHFLTEHTLREIVILFIQGYLAVTIIYTVYAIIRMYVMIYFFSDKKGGRARFIELKKAGKLIQTPIYSVEEIEKNEDLGVVRLTVFRADNPVSNRFVLVLPGGGYAHCCINTGGYPVLKKINELGYTAFMLEYRTGRRCSAEAPFQDVAQALKFINGHKEEYKVTMYDYALMGFSAGGNLAALFGVKNRGYGSYESFKPGAIILGYPWTNVNHWNEQPYMNVWKTLLAHWLSVRAFFYIFGIPNTREQRDTLCVQDQIDEEYPKTFMFTGGLDFLVPASRHADVLDDAFQKKGIKYIYRKYFRLPHGIGVGKGTSAEKWMEEAISFWIKENEE